MFRASKSTKMIIQVNILVIYNIRFDSRSPFSHSNFDWDKNAIIFGVANSLTVHIENKEKNNLVLSEVPTPGFDGTTETAEAKYPINLTRSERKLCLTLHYNGSNSFLFVNATKIYQFKV